MGFFNSSQNNIGEDNNQNGLPTANKTESEEVRRLKGEIEKVKNDKRNIENEVEALRTTSARLHSESQDIDKGSESEKNITDQRTRIEREAKQRADELDRVNQHLKDLEAKLSLENKSESTV